MSALLPCPKTWSEWRVWLLGFENRVRPLTRYEEVSAHVDAAASQLEEWNRAPPPLPTRDDVARVVLDSFHEACLEAPRCTPPGCKCSMDAADAVLRLLGGEAGCG